MPGSAVLVFQYEGVEDTWCEEAAEGAWIVAVCPPPVLSQWFSGDGSVVQMQLQPWDILDNSQSCSRSVAPAVLLGVAVGVVWGLNIKNISLGYFLIDRNILSRGEKNNPTTKYF